MSLKSKSTLLESKWLTSDPSVVDLLSSDQQLHLEYDLDTITPPPPEVIDQFMKEDDDDIVQKQFLEWIEGGESVGGSLECNRGLHQMDSPHHNSTSIPSEASFSERFSTSCSIEKRIPYHNSPFSSHAHREKEQSSIFTPEPLFAAVGESSSSSSPQPNYFYGGASCGDSSLDSFEGSSISSASALINTLPSQNHGRGTSTDMTDEEKYSRIREQNNIASRKYRDKKKTRMADIQKQLEEVGRKNSQLKVLFEKLLLQHDTCHKAMQILINHGYKLPKHSLT